jgi:hypothetical protein
MDSQEYIRKIIGGWEEGSLPDFAKWAAEEAAPWVREEVKGVLGGEAKQLSAEEAVRSGLAISYKDLRVLPKQARYYGAHLTMFQAELDRFCKAVDVGVQHNDSPFAGATRMELRQGIYELLLDAIVMLERAGAIRLDLPGAYDVYRINHDRTFEVFKAAEQMIYGRYSRLTHTDRAAFAPVSVLRTAIELRMRRAFGVQSYHDPRNDGAQPIQLSKLFEVIFSFERQIHASVDLHDVNRVYKWSNPYLHAGRRDYVWVAGFGLQFLRPLFFGPKQLRSRSGWSMNGGLEMPAEVWTRVRRHFEKHAKRKGWLLNNAHPDEAECVLF